MTSVEEKLRVATERTAAGFTQADLSPLRLAAAPDHALRGVGGAGGPSLRRGLAAFGAAVAVLAVLAGSLVLAGQLRHRARTSGTADAGNLVTSGPLAGIPRYFVELRRSGPLNNPVARQADVIESVTGRVLASLRVPEPYGDFAAVVGAADDRTFVLGAERWPTKKDVSTPFYTKLFELRIGARQSGHLVVHLRPLGLKIPVNWLGDGLALSPDGTELAFAASPWTGAIASRIWVYSMITGMVHSWQSRGQIGRSPWDVRCLSWSPNDRTVAFFWHDTYTVNLLDTTGSAAACSARAGSSSSSPRPRTRVGTRPISLPTAAK